MITPSLEYWKTLYQIQDKNFPQYSTVGPFPKDEPIYNIDLNTRLITPPKFIGVERDQDAEIIYFKCARYIDGQDLTKVCCVIQYQTPKGDKRLSPVPFYYSVPNEDDYIYIPWEITQGVTQYKGTVEFAFRFFLVDPDAQIFYYSLNTQPAKTQVLEGMDTTSNENYNFEMDIFSDLLQQIYILTEQYKAGLYWLEPADKEVP